MNLNDVINQTINNSNNVIKAEQGDYINDETGLLMCGQCHTPKQTRISFLGMMRTPMCLCQCKAEQWEREEEERKRIEFEAKIAHMRDEGFSEKYMQKWTFANDDMSNDRVTKALQRYVENFADFRKKGKGLLLYGTVGTGKTYAACEVANALIDKGYSAYVTNFAKILNTLQGTFDKQDYIDSLNRYQLLVIDDLGIERETPFAKEQVFNVIDARYRMGLPMIVTTNLTMSDIKQPDNIENRRIYDRILERCFPIEMVGKSKRRGIIIKEYSDMKDVLGL